MKQIVISFVLLIIVLGISVWSFNNENGVGNGIHSISTNINGKIDAFDYSGTVQPGAGHNNDLSGSTNH
jgi:hypothetical protein